MDEMDLMSQDMMQDMAALEAQMDQQMGLSVRARLIVSDIHTWISGDSAPPPPMSVGEDPAGERQDFTSARIRSAAVVSVVLTCSTEEVAWHMLHPYTCASSPEASAGQVSGKGGLA